MLANHKFRKPHARLIPVPTNQQMLDCNIIRFNQKLHRLRRYMSRDDLRYYQACINALFDNLLIDRAESPQGVPQ